MLKKSMILVCGFAFIFTFSSFAYSQEKNAKNSTDLATIKLQYVKIKNQSVSDVFSSISHNYNIPIGVEIALNDSHLTYHKIEFEKGTLSELLDKTIGEINKRENQYSWKIVDGVVHIFPKENYRDEILNSVLDTKINKVNIKKNITRRGFTESLLNNSDIKEVLRLNSLSRSGWNLSAMYIPLMKNESKLEFSNMTLRAILNKTVKESIEVKNWHIFRSTHNPQTFDLYLTSGNANVLMKDGKPIEILENMLEISEYN